MTTPVHCGRKSVQLGTLWSVCLAARFWGVKICGRKINFLSAFGHHFEVTIHTRQVYYVFATSGRRWMSKGTMHDVTPRAVLK
jgi:hypothetical protein